MIDKSMMALALIILYGVESSCTADIRTPTKMQCQGIAMGGCVGKFFFREIKGKKNLRFHEFFFSGYTQLIKMLISQLKL